MTGLSGSGKSTLAVEIHKILRDKGVSCILLDGDTLRAGLNRDLGFCANDRVENIRRAAEVAKILVDAGHTVLAAFITPLECLRRTVRDLFAPGRYVEVFLACPLEICEQRDPKGLYELARTGRISEFTGISSPFEVPAAADLTIPTSRQTVEQSVAMLMDFIQGSLQDKGSLRQETAGLDAVPHAPVRADRRPARVGPRVCVIGLDCVPPSVVFGEFGRELPTLRALMEHGVWGPLRSTDPPITIPAWATITTGKDPGELGIYGFRNRRDHGYGEMFTADASHVQAPRVWDYLEEKGLKSSLIGIPQTYPARAHHGITIAGFPAPHGESRLTYPPDLAKDLHEICRGEYMVDVAEFRTERKDRLLRDLYTMVERRFRAARDFLIHGDWDFFMMVEVAPDRLHHAFWRYWQPDHPLYEPGNPYESVIPEFYRHLDQCVGSLLAMLDDNTTVIVLSDHGAKSLQGGFCINEWLIRQGLLSLHGKVEVPVGLSADMVDWGRTKAWSEGGYYARVFLNVKGREPLGIIDPADFEPFRDSLAEMLAETPGDNGDRMRNTVLKPDGLFAECRNVPPDLMVYFDGLNRRSLGTVGTGHILTRDNDQGPDGANHDLEGIFISARLSDLRRGVVKGTNIEGASCLDITPTILHLYGMSVPGLRGSVIALGGGAWGTPCCSTGSPDSVCGSGTGPSMDSRSLETEGFTPDEEEEVKKRLAELGYI